MPIWQQYLYYRELPIAGNFVVEKVILEMLEAFVKKLDVVGAGWDLVSYRWLGQSYFPKLWQWLKKRWDSKCSLIKQ